MPVATARGVLRFDEHRDALLQSFINAPELPAGFQMKDGQAEAAQYGDEERAIPKLQPPADGLEKFHAMQ